LSPLLNAEIAAIATMGRAMNLAKRRLLSVIGLLLL
jgi:hypothetical protein